MPTTRPTTPPRTNPTSGARSAGSASNTMIAPREKYRPAAIEPDHCGAHHRGVEINRNEERDEVDDREAHVEEPISEHVRGRREEEDRDEEEDPHRAGDQEREERQKDESLLLAKDAKADLRELPPDPQPLQESKLSRCRRIRRGGNRRRRSPHRLTAAHASLRI